jgi:hypothetical protein
MCIKQAFQKQVVLLLGCFLFFRVPLSESNSFVSLSCSSLRFYRYACNLVPLWACDESLYCRPPPPPSPILPTPLSAFSFAIFQYSYSVVPFALGTLVNSGGGGGGTNCCTTLFHDPLCISWHHQQNQSLALKKETTLRLVVRVQAVEACRVSVGISPLILNLNTS